MTHRFTVQAGRSTATLLLTPTLASSAEELLGHLRRPDDSTAMEIVVGDVPLDHIDRTRPCYRGTDLVDAVAALDDHVGNHHADTHLVIHAGAVARDGLTVLLPGPSGSGKSTLVAALVRRGWGYITDEIVLVDRRDGSVTPYPRPLSLRGDARLLLADGPARSGSSADPALVAPSALGRIHDGPVSRPTAVVFPRWQAAAAPEVQATTAAETLHAIARDLRNLPHLGAAGLEDLATWTVGATGSILAFGDAAEGAAALDEAVSGA